MWNFFQRRCWDKRRREKTAFASKRNRNINLVLVAHSVDIFYIDKYDKYFLAQKIMPGKSSNRFFGAVCSKRFDIG